MVHKTGEVLYLEYTTTKLETETVGDVKYKYAYDAVGNIVRIYSVAEDGSATTLHSYTYDSNNQLTRDMDAENSVIVDYTYDASGNILQKKTTAWKKYILTLWSGRWLSWRNY